MSEPVTELLVARHGQIVSLLQTRDDKLPLPRRWDNNTTSGFAHGAENRARSCPDCLANGGATVGCETCGGSGRLTSNRVDRVAVADQLPDDGATTDPYAKNDVRPYGFDPTRHDRGIALNAAIQTAERELGRFPGFRPESGADELAYANRHPYQWESDRRQMWRDFDYAALDAALELLRARDEVGCRLIHAVYVYGWLDHSPVVAVVLDRALSFIDVRMPDPIRAPGTSAPAVAKESLWRGKSDRHRAARELRAVRVRRAHVEWGWSTGEIASHESLSERRVRQLLAGDAGTAARIASGPAA